MTPSRGWGFVLILAALASLICIGDALAQTGSGSGSAPLTATAPAKGSDAGSAAVVAPAEPTAAPPAEPAATTEASGASELSADETTAVTDTTPEEATGVRFGASANGSAAADLVPPRGNEQAFIKAMVESKKEDPHYLALRYQRARSCVNNKDLLRDKEVTAFLKTPREKFCRTWNLKRAYDHAYLDIHYGVTISGPHLVSRMTSCIDVQPGDKVLEIGTGSGYQAGVLAWLTDKVFTIEIIEPLASETDKIYTELAANGYPEFGNIKRKADDGYYGWEEHAPFDKIIVTCGIDHIPPALLKQLKPNGIMVIPVGPPGAQVCLKVCKKVGADGEIEITREDLYKGRKKVPFVPFTKKGGGNHFTR